MSSTPCLGHPARGRGRGVGWATAANLLLSPTAGSSHSGCRQTGVPGCIFPVANQNKAAAGCFLSPYRLDTGFSLGLWLTGGERAEGWAQHHQICPVPAQLDRHGRGDQLSWAARTGLSASADALTPSEQNSERVLLCNVSSCSRCGGRESRSLLVFDPHLHFTS